MREIFLINAFTETKEKLDDLRTLIESLKSKNFEVCLITHTSTPQDIVDRCDYYIYDKQNPLIDDPEVQYWFWYDCNEYKISFVCKNTKIHFLAYYRLIFGGISYLKSLGYDILHSFDYDIIFNSFEDIHDNTNLLKEYDIVEYRRDDNTRVTYFSLNLKNLDSSHLIYDKDELHTQYKKYYQLQKFPLIENLLFDEFLPKKVFSKNLSNLTKDCIINTHFFGSKKTWETCLFTREDNLYLFVFIEENDNVTFDVLYNNKHISISPHFTQFYLIDKVERLSDLKIFINNELHFNHKFPDDLSYIRTYSNFYKK